jgi:hypothetical protein
MCEKFGLITFKPMDLTLKKKILRAGQMFSSIGGARLADLVFFMFWRISAQWCTNESSYFGEKKISV